MSCSSQYPQCLPHSKRSIKPSWFSEQMNKQSCLNHSDFPPSILHINLSWDSRLVHFLPLRHFSNQRNAPYSEILTHSVSYFIWERIYWRVLPTMWIEFPSLLPISTLLLFLSPSEHSTQYSAEIIFCWMRFGHKSRADLLRPLHSLFPRLLSTWQFKSLITLTHNPFAAEQSRPNRWAAPAGTWSVLKMVLSSDRQDTFIRTHGCPVLSGMIKVSPPPLFPPASASRRSLHCHSSQALSSTPSLGRQENPIAFCVPQIAVYLVG